MFGLRFIKMQPTSYLLQYKKGRIVREGAGLSFFYYAPTSSLDAAARTYISDDPQKLSARVINVIKVLTRKELQTLPLRDALRASDTLVQQVGKGLAASTEISSLGLEVIGLSILAIKPNPETGRALEAEA